MSGFYVQLQFSSMVLLHIGPCSRLYTHIFVHRVEWNREKQNRTPLLFVFRTNSIHVIRLLIEVSIAIANVRILFWKQNIGKLHEKSQNADSELYMFHPKNSWRTFCQNTSWAANNGNLQGATSIWTPPWAHCSWNRLSSSPFCSLCSCDPLVAEPDSSPRMTQLYFLSGNDVVEKIGDFFLVQEVIRTEKRRKDWIWILA